MRKHFGLGVITALIVIILLGGGGVLAYYYSRPAHPTVLPSVANIPESPAVPAGDENTLPSKVLISDVPFTSQAPFAQWDDPRQQGGCEETSVLMAGKWATGGTIASKQAAKDEILALSYLAESMFASYQDSSAEDTLKLLQKYFHYSHGEVKYNVQTLDIKRELAHGHILIVPADGRKLHNPNFSGGGPDRHNLVIIGYDDTKQLFITNDPGTRVGKGYEYSYIILMDALQDYPTGDHQPILTSSTAMIVVEKA